LVADIPFFAAFAPLREKRDVSVRRSFAKFGGLSALLQVNVELTSLKR
jgi:hypothetical protein